MRDKRKKEEQKPNDKRKIIIKKVDVCSKYGKKGGQRSMRTRDSN